MSAGNQYVKAPKWYKGRNKWMNHSGFKIEVGVARSPFLLNEFARRKRLMLPSTCLVNGPPGRGKTYWALRIAQMIDPNFDVTVQVPMTRMELLVLIGEHTPIKRGQVIIVDEAQFAASNRNWGQTEQKELVEILQSVRSRGYVFIFVALSEKVIDNQIRNFIVDFRVDLVSPGYAKVYSQYTDFHGNVMTPKLGETRLRLPGFEGCNDPACLTCKHSGLLKSEWSKREQWSEIGFKPCNNIRAVYERRKKSMLDAHTASVIEKQQEKTNRDKKLDKQEAYQLIINNLEKIGRVRGGRLNVTSLQFILSQELGYELPRSVANRLREEFEVRYPTLKIGT